jgi:hypothetical protein
MEASLSYLAWVTRKCYLPRRKCSQLTSFNRTGFGQHGDYLFGWDGDSLQRAMDTCTDMGGVPEQCRALTVLSDAEINRCTQKPVIDEVVEGSCKSNFTSLSFPTTFRLYQFESADTDFIPCLPYRPPRASWMQSDPERTKPSHDGQQLLRNRCPNCNCPRSYDDRRRPPQSDDHHRC